MRDKIFGEHNLRKSSAAKENIYLDTQTPNCRTKKAFASSLNFPQNYLISKQNHIKD